MYSNQLCARAFLRAAFALFALVIFVSSVHPAFASLCTSPTRIVSNYQELRSTPGRAGDTVEVTASAILGCFSYSESDPNGMGDDGGIVLGAQGKGYWVRHIERTDASASISARNPVNLDWYQLVDGEDITSLWESLARTYAPAMYVQVPSRSLTLNLAPFSTDAYEITNLRIYESDAAVTLRQRDPGETWLHFGSLEELVLGTDVKKASRDDYNLTFQGSAHRNGHEYDAGSGKAMIDLDPDYLDHCACNWHLRVNTSDAFANGIKKSGLAHVDTIFVSGRHVNSSIEFSDFGKSFVANEVIVAEDVYVSDPFGAGYGWKGDSNGNTVSGAWSKNRGIRLSGALKVVGTVEIQYGWAALRSFFTDRWGDPGNPFTIRVKDQGFLGEESGYPGTKIEPSDAVLNNAVKWDGQLDYDGYWVTDDPNDESHTRYVRIVEENRWGTNQDVLTTFVEANLCDDNSGCDEDENLFMSYFDLTIANLENGFSGTAAGGVGIPYDRIHNWTIRGDGANPASPEGSKPIRLAADHATFRDGQFHDIVYATPSNLGDAGVTTNGNVGRNLTITGVIAIDPDVSDVALSEVTWTGTARVVLDIPSGTSVHATNLQAPDGSSIEGSGVLVLDGTQVPLPYTFGGGTDTDGEDGSTDTTSTADLSITNIAVASGKSYTVGDSGFGDGSALYIDRSYTAVSPVPSVIERLAYIQTANDDKNADLGSEDFLSFDVNRDAVIYVLHDDRLARPAWMTDWTDTGDNVNGSDGYTTYSIFAKFHSAGSVTLGSNSETRVANSSMYVVAVGSAKTFSIDHIRVESGASYRVADTGLQDGATLYVDRSYTALSPVPSSLDGLTFIQTANDDKNVSPGSSNFLSFDVSGDAVVYVLHDDRIALPSWLSDWTDVGDDVRSSDGYTTYSVLSKAFPFGTVVLGSNTESTAASSSMYLVAARPSTSEQLNRMLAEKTTLTGRRVDVPEEFMLSQNYPNPFNPTTTIVYSLPREGNVRIEVFDIGGRLVDVILDAPRSAGFHRTVFNATHLSSGVYFYRLVSGDIVLTKRMTILR